MYMQYCIRNVEVFKIKCVYNVVVFVLRLCLTYSSFTLKLIALGRYLLVLSQYSQCICYWQDLILL